MLETEVQSNLRLQRLMGHLFLFPLGLLIVGYSRFLYRLKIRNLSAVRREFRELAKENNSFLVCPNHLTLVDSVLLLWALAPVSWYFFNYRYFCWNLPAIENLSRRWYWKGVTYLAKCIPIDRFGDKEHFEERIETVRSLLRTGESVMIFPEGTRSRSGKIDPEKVTYGVGKILAGLEDVGVLCVYMRGDMQNTYTNFPHRGDSFDVSLKLCKPKSSATGLRAARDYSAQIINVLKELEDKYFEGRGLSLSRE